MTEMVSTSSTGEATAVRYDKDADGIVTLTLDDPNASANTMNEIYVERSMRAAVDRLYDELAADPEHRSRASSWPAPRRPSSRAATSR